MNNILIWILVIVLNFLFSIVNAYAIPNANSWSYILGMICMLTVIMLFELKE